MSPLVFHLIAHTHWDREWYLTQAAFGARLVLMMDDLLGRLEQDPAFRAFLLDGQAILIADYLAARPGAAPRVEALVRAGRLQVGPWYVLADEQIPSGEALVRNLLLGRAEAERLGARTDVLYTPDAFGHPAMLPDLAREFVIPAGVLWRGFDPERARGRDLARWRGPAGGELLLYHLPPAGYEAGSQLFDSGGVTPEAWGALRSQLVSRAASPHVAVFVGADHHWAHPAIGRLRDRLAALEPEDEVRVSSIDEFLRAAAAESDSLPVLTGELRWSYGYTWTLQGVHATRAPLKRANDRVELLLERVAEPLAALAGVTSFASLLGVAWRGLVAAHFHDAICGCSSDAVAREVELRLADADSVAREVVRRAVDRLVGHSPDRARASGAPRWPRLVLWNPIPRPRSGVVIAETGWLRRDVLVGPPGARRPRFRPGARPFGLASADGRRCAVQTLGRRIAYLRLDADRHYPDQDEVDVVRVATTVESLPPLGFASLGISEPDRLRSGDVTARGTRMTNGLIEVAVTRGGALRLLDRASGQRFEGLLRLEDEADAGDTYTWCPARPRRLERSAGPVRTRVLARGPLVGVLESRWTMRGGHILARLLVRVHAGSPLVHCRLVLDNRWRDHRLRARLPTGLPGAGLLAGTQFGALPRQPVRFDSRDYADEIPVTTAPVHRFAAAARGRRGLALLLPGFGEIEWTARGDLLLTLLRAVGRLSRDDLPARPGHAAWPEPTPLAQCPGVQAVELALAPVDEHGWERPERIVELWEDAFLPVQAFWLPEATELSMPADSVALEGDGLVCSAVKPAEAGGEVVLRCYNTRAKPVEGRWRFGRPRSRAWRTRADERGATDVALAENGQILPFRAEPLGWVTHLVR